MGSSYFVQACGAGKLELQSYQKDGFQQTAIRLPSVSNKGHPPISPAARCSADPARGCEQPPTGPRQDRFSIDRFWTEFPYMFFLSFQTIVPSATHWPSLLPPSLPILFIRYPEKKRNGIVKIYLGLKTCEPRKNCETDLASFVDGGLKHWWVFIPPQPSIVYNSTASTEKRVILQKGVCGWARQTGLSLSRCSFTDVGRV